MVELAGIEPATFSLRKSSEVASLLGGLKVASLVPHLVPLFAGDLASERIEIMLVGNRGEMNKEVAGTCENSCERGATCTDSLTDGGIGGG
jgi:hypothetical protein